LGFVVVVVAEIFRKYIQSPRISTFPNKSLLGCRCCMIVGNQALFLSVAETGLKKGLVEHDDNDLCMFHD
jgi:hypothetical protein